MAFNPKATKGYNRNYRKLQGPRAVKQVVRASHTKAGPRIAYQRLPRRTQRRYERKVSRQTHAGVRRHNQSQRQLAAKRAATGAFRWRLAMGDTNMQKLSGRTAYNLFGAPGGVERADFADYYDRLWQRYRGRYPSIPKGETPRLAFEQHPSLADRRTAAAYVVTDKPPGKRTVHVLPGTVYGADLRPSERKFAGSSARYDRKVPLHEWVHVFQGPSARTTGLIEGGADAFARLVGRQRGAPAYDKYVRQVLRKKGRKWVFGGQFR